MTWTKIPNETANRGRKQRTSFALSVFADQAYLALPGCEVGQVDLFYDESTHRIAIEASETGTFRLSLQRRAKTVRLRVPNWLFAKLELPIGIYEIDQAESAERLVLVLPQPQHKAA